MKSDFVQHYFDELTMPLLKEHYNSTKSKKSLHCRIFQCDGQCSERGGPFCEALSSPASIMNMHRDKDRIQLHRKKCIIFCSLKRQNT
jgi:hypothetical protein